MRKRAWIADIIIALGLALIMGLAGCQTAQERTAAPVVAPEESRVCEVHFLNLTGRPLMVFMRRLDGPGLAMLPVPTNLPMTKEQFDQALRDNPDGEIAVRILKDVPCGEYQIMVPALRLVGRHRICGCKDGQYNIAFFVPSHERPDAGLDERT